MFNLKDEEKYYFDLEHYPLESERKEKKEKKKRRILTVFLCLLFLILGTIAGLTINKLIHPYMKAEAGNTYGEIEAILSKYWLYGNDYENVNKVLEDKAFYGMSKFENDPYTTYMSKDELNDFSSSINMDYVGIGVQYVLQDSKGLIERVYANSPAEKAGLKAGDMIIAVDHKNVEGLTSTQIKELVIGKSGTEVIITIIRNNEELDVSVIRGQVDNSVYCYSQDDYVIMELESFGENTAKDIMNYLNQYEDYEKIIIDLRDNTGGYQTSVKEIAGLFIGNNKVYLKQADKYGNEIADTTSCVKTYDNFHKIILLVNGNTASAAEVFTICLKEQLDNVTIVGTTTYGKGVIQSTHLLENGGALKFTTYYWYSPNGVSINAVGIEPDIEVKLDDIVYETYIIMDDDVKYEYDDVSDHIRIAQMSLKYLGYSIEREDGYFDYSLMDALSEFKHENGIGDDSVLDKVTYETIISHLLANISNPDKDYQMIKAMELINN